MSRHFTWYESMFLFFCGLLYLISLALGFYQMTFLCRWQLSYFWSSFLLACAFSSLKERNYCLYPLWNKAQSSLDSSINLGLSVPSFPSWIALTPFLYQSHTSPLRVMHLLQGVILRKIRSPSPWLTHETARLLSFQESASPQMYHKVKSRHYASYNISRLQVSRWMS